MKTTLFRIGLVLFLFWGNVAYSEPLHLLAQDFPPLAMRVSGESSGNPDDPLTGIYMDIVKEMSKRSGIEYTLKIYTWERAYKTALETPGCGLFSFRTPEREGLFYWVGPLIPMDWTLLAKKSRNIKLKSLEDARKYKIGGYKNGAIGMFLEKQGFDVESVSFNHLNVRKLDAEKIDLWAVPEAVGQYLAKREGVSGFERVFTIKELGIFMGLNKSVSPDLIAKLNKIIQEMKDDGTLEKIYVRYR
ncbi:MAG: hypothetical protein BWK80_26385 [Desulfobacteraceae bacterium IS3]|nr:MAG: hypothetical protein BWK80_26385 [Desulfobacteraceae bacterium IS3]